MKKNTLISIFGGLAILVIAFFAFKQISKREKPKEEKSKREIKKIYASIVELKDIPVKIKSNGEVVSKDKIDLFSEVRGILKSSNFNEGNFYRKGQVLVSIDNSEYYAGVKSQRSDFYNSVISIMPDIKLDFPQEFDKWQSFLNAISIDKYIPKLPNFTTDKEKYFVSGRGVLGRYHNVKNSEIRLSKYYIKAPFDGVVSMANTNYGALINSGQKIGEFTGTKNYELSVSIDANDIKFIKKGKKVKVTNPDTDTEFEGVVSRINSVINRQNQSVRVFVRIKGKNIRPGMYLDVEILARNAKDSYEIDRSLIFDNNKIYVIENDTLLSEKEIKIVYNGDKKSIIKGVSNGDIVAQKQIPGAYKGMVVEIVK